MSESAAAGGAPAASDARRGFASDNHAAVHPDVLAAIAAANEGHAPAYGADRWTERARQAFRRHFGTDAEAYLVFNGSGANVTSIDAVTRGFESVICAATAHMHVDECGAPERIAGAKLLTVATDDGKLAPADVARWESRRGDDHFAQPRVVSITQATELGTVYTAAETRAIADAAAERGMLLHVDGARLANAAARLDASLAEITTEAGVDLVSFGGTKNGLMFGDAVVFVRPELGDGFEFVRKQLGQLASKSRYLAAQFEALLEGDLWLRNAAHANAMATRLADAVSAIDGIEIVHPVESNAIFARFPRAAIDRLLAAWPSEQPFYVWDEHVEGYIRSDDPDRPEVVRWMCAWDTRPEDVDAFAAAARDAVEAAGTR
ncbi:MAG TPA: beta-eliminating lyase-related protein [Solirubrobacterales bacterium]|nr:beta-eliminating lyase-related protein [Solirubrobacterales bacterium]